jgi:AcrR family transcriptional regulator
VLVPFVVDRLERGDRVIHLVESRDAYLERLATETDVSAAVASGQLDVRTWHQSYLSDGTFKAARMLAYVRRSLREGQTSAFRATRLIGDMEWAAAGVPGVDELIEYESELDAILSRPRVSVVCAYDARRHSPDRLQAILRVHQTALVAGRLQTGNGQVAPPRERILAAASLLFAENGVVQTGVDTLIEAAQVAKATFYRHFPSKDALILAWLKDPRTRWFDRVRVLAEGRASKADEVFPRLFEAVADWLETEDFVGCPYLNTAVEISDPAHPATIAIRDYLAEIGDYLEERVATAGHADAARLGRELHALLAGSISLGVANRTNSFVIAARDAAVQLLGEKRARA